MSTKQVTREMISEYITYYAKYKKDVALEEGELSKLAPAASTAQYGIEATMPKAQGKISDPTFVQATSQPQDDYIRRRIAVIRAVDGYRKHLDKLRDLDVFELWRDGYHEKEIAERLSVSKMTVHRCKRDITNQIYEGEKVDG